MEATMSNLRPIDKLEIHILVDNATDSLSSIPKHVESEFSYLQRNCPANASAAPITACPA
jgi:hypothetical protein